MNECICLSSDDEDEAIQESPQVVFVKSSSRAFTSSTASNFSNTSDQNLTQPRPIIENHLSQEDVCMILSDDEETMAYTSPPKKDEANEIANNANDEPGFSNTLSSPPIFFTKSSITSSIPPFLMMNNNLLSDDEEEEEYQYKLPSPPISMTENQPIRESERSLSQHEYSQTFSNHTILTSQSMEYSDSQNSSQYYESQSQSFGSCSQLSFSASRKGTFKKIAIGKFAASEIVTMFDENLQSSVGGEDIISDFTQYIARSDTSLVNITKLPIAHSIQWKRRLALDYVLFVFQKQKRDPGNSIRYDSSNMENQTVEFFIPSIAIRMTGSSFLKIYTASKESNTNVLHKYLTDVIHRLDCEEGKILMQEHIYPHLNGAKFKIILIIEGLNECIKKYENEQYQNSLQSSKKKKKPNNSLPQEQPKRRSFQKEDIEKFKLKTLFTLERVQIVETKNLTHTASILKGVTNRFQIAPYKKITSAVDFIQKPSGGLNSIDSWTMQLIQIPKISEKAAKAIAQQYPSYSSLMKAYKKCKSETEKRLLISSIKNGEKRLGDSVSRALYNFYCMDNEDNEGTEHNISEESNSQRGGDTQELQKKKTQQPRKKKKTTSTTSSSTEHSRSSDRPRDESESILFEELL
ncbi:hypothetical protein C9374_008938 [Naegleria lovaniensis]|uniref:ERCC4 domain-containing protein n=1 Tax=Naegleria lovaniensis TaxID=51637 RepID=A0AA88GFZ6_NAELO|nr:uncharacterized protein C9374_008938 [Naegleria lovaniensis]KAG2377853.1 hypothetical protein C9374_008938 [Naegleria lovaniensis]